MDDMFYDELREAVSYFKKKPKGVNAMCEIMREFERESKNEGRREGRAEGRAQERESIMRNLREEKRLRESPINRYPR
ncbi:hypothetical protein [Dubosiella muris]|uniref:Uncharacterized protein n=1 Tax=Dubosiella muris TaxID=3038133 RepID=A0AC61R6Q3_9FIRM|nr:hypothetical protein [Dubosiella muris]TGY65727.1 hypothetical protein E5336_07030 [Dubosiella muris]